MRKQPKRKPLTKLQKALEADDAYKNPTPCPPATPRAPEAILENKRRLWASIRAQPALAELARTDVVFQRILSECITYFDVAEVTLGD